MMNSRIVRDKNGVVTELTNFKILEGGALQPIEPTRNAVIIDFVDGGITPCVSVECKDEAMLEMLNSYAMRVLKGEG